MNRIPGILIFICTGFLFSILEAQVLNQQMVVDTLYESTKVNPEPDKAYIHVSSQVPNLRFDSNRKIEKVMKVSSGNWEIWLPGGTHILKIDAEGYQQLELQPFVYAKKRSFELRVKAIRKSDYVLDTDPQSALVSIDGQEAGETPLKATLEYGEHLIKIKKQKYEELTYKITVDEPRVAENKKLIRQKGLLSLDTDPTNIRVTIDNKETLLTPCDVSLDIGEHTISIREKFYEDVTKVIDIPASKIIQKIPLTYRQAMYHIETEPPSASVLVDGEEMGKTPISKLINLGKHHVDINLINYDDLSYDMTINENGWQETKNMARYYVHEAELEVGGALPFEKKISMDSTLNTPSLGTDWCLCFRYRYNINSHLALGIYYFYYDIGLKNYAYLENGSVKHGDMFASQNYMGIEARWTVHRGGLEPSCYLLAGGFFGSFSSQTDYNNVINSLSGISLGVGFCLMTSISDHVALSADIVGILGSASWDKQVNPYYTSTTFNPSTLMYTISLSYRWGEH